MEKKYDSKEWQRDFLTFLDSDEIEPPSCISEEVRATVFRSLHPSPFRVFAKLALIVGMSSSLTLLLCPQFGYGRSLFSFMSFFMQYGDAVCHFACGALFISTGVLLGASVLRPEELRVLRETEFLQISALSAIALGAFVCFGASVLASLGSVWLLGGALGGIISLEGTYFFRERILKTV